MKIAGTNTAAAELIWRKSSYSGAEGGECVEVAACPGSIHVRDSKVAAGPTLRVAAEGWAAFVHFATRD
ncbi:DUF397 domain-containing protein [Streptomyces sp. V1I6]|uniref:DUF397 domain-containing protein n=1 Tax=Streptomyces sp. V1I6 TaxID=3042273 RepID=UPI002787D266|nr:DUF397 domain-containing protein [Streptomyces sp. V1I6]MDQ0846055.1 hypothetical protein [Streptomyces sp. V1I6]